MSSGNMVDALVWADCFSDVDAEGVYDGVECEDRLACLCRGCAGKGVSEDRLGSRDEGPATIW